MHLMQGHPALSTPSLPCTHPSTPSLIFFASPFLLHHFTSSFLPSLSSSTPSGLSSFPFNETMWKAAQWGAQYCKICCVRLAWFVLLLFFCVCGSIWVSGRWDFELNVGFLFVFWEHFTFLKNISACEDCQPLSNIPHPQTDISSAAALRIPTLTQGHLAYSNLSAWNITHSCWIWNSQWATSFCRSSQ